MAKQALLGGILLFAAARSLQRLVTEPLLVSLDPVFITSSSLLVAAILMLPGICRSGGKDFWKFAVLLGIINIALPALLFTISQDYLSASIAGIFVSLVPVAVAVAALLFLKEKLSLAGWGGIAIASVAVLVATLFSESLPLSVKGAVFSIFALVAVAASYVVLRRQGDWNLFSFVSAQALVGGIVFLPFFDPGVVATLSIKEAGLIIILGLSAVIIPQVIMVFLLRFTPAAKVAVSHYLTPAITIILASVFLGEEVGAINILAATLAVLGAWMVTCDRSQKIEKKNPGEELPSIEY